MLNKLREVEDEIVDIIVDMIAGKRPYNTMYIDYHPPFVSRLWFQYDEETRVYLHRIEPCTREEALFHPHPWKSAVRVLDGYLMGVGYSETNEMPNVACTLAMAPGSAYEMVDPNGWHYVRPMLRPSYSLMVTGERNDRDMPVKPDKEFRRLGQEEVQELLMKVYGFYSMESHYLDFHSSFD